MALLQTGLIVIGKPDSEHVSINITDRNPDGWLSGTLDICSGPFSGRCPASFIKGELRKFAGEVQRLYQDLAGTATLSPMENYIDMKLTGNGRGQVTAEGTARDSFVDGIHLAFRVDFDQTDLPGIIAALRSADPA